MGQEMCRALWMADVRSVASDSMWASFPTISGRQPDGPIERTKRTEGERERETPLFLSLAMTKLFWLGRGARHWRQYLSPPPILSCVIPPLLCLPWGYVKWDTAQPNNSFTLKTFPDSPALWCVSATIIRASRSRLRAPNVLFTPVARDDRRKFTYTSFQPVNTAVPSRKHSSRVKRRCEGQASRRRK